MKKMSKSLRKLLCLLVLLNAADYRNCSSSLLAPRNYCGYQHSDDYNRKNDEISIDEFPWMAQILYDEDRESACTGTLINNRYVLTAAHCILNRFKNATAVRLGDYNVTTDKDCITHSTFGEECSDPVQEYNIELKIPHPKFSVRSALNDIGLIRLSKEVIYSDYVRPICLPLTSAVNLKDDQELAVSGWGLLGLGEEKTTVKKKVLAKLVSYEKCRETYINSQKPVSQFHLCATETESYTCQGDSGGPLMLPVKSQWEQVGILSYGKGCGAQFPSVYINTAKYLHWIKQNLKK